MDELYIKMVRALHGDFFKDWQLNNGDQVYLIKEIAIADYSCSSEHGLYTVFDGKLATEEHSCTENWIYVERLLKEGLVRPIPSQEQLQAIILKKYHDNGLDIADRENLYLFWRLQEWLHDQDFSEMAYLSFECIWLKFLMYVDGKKWDGEAWI